jgi:hypothetical protein
VHQQEARLRCNRDANLVVELEPAASFEVFLLEENLDVAEELLLIFGCQPVEQGEIRFENPAPMPWRRLRPQPISFAVRI